MTDTAVIEGAEPQVEAKKGAGGYAVHHQAFGLRARRAQFVLLIVLVPITLIPLYVMVTAAFKTAANADVRQMWQFPNPFSIDGLSAAWEALAPNFVNSFGMVIPAVVISCFLGSFNGYLLSKWRFRGDNAIFTLMLVGMFIPYQSVLIPMVKFLQLIGLYGTIPGLILVHVVYGIPIATLIFRNYYTATIPTALIEAAALDGASLIRTYYRIVLPLSAPGFVVAGIFQFTNIWNDFLFGIVVIPNPNSQPVTAALNNLSGTQTVDWNVVMAGALVAAIPTLIAYLAFGKYFVQGLTSGSVK
ncbi:carbohydrate ABC transporter permease [Cellulomonas sp.]|uniref:carbohydrate ABC transporter permease n=1 Tax=Cellulomonas sp. TaxID=40001 RepID=UPI003BAC8B7E